MKRTTFFAAACAAVFTIAGCNGGQEQASGSTATTTTTAGGSTSGGGGKAFTITMIAKSSTNPVFMSAKTGAEKAADELSKSTGRQIKIDWETPPTEDGQVQAQNIQDAVNKGSDAILMSCSDASKVTNAINSAVDKGVPVMTFDSDAADSKRFAFYGADDDAVGTQVMDELGTQMNGKGNVAVLAGNQNAPNLQKRANAVKAEMTKKYPNMKLVGVFYHTETAQDAAKEVIAEMKAHPEIDGWAMVGGWPLFSTALMDLDPAKVKIVAVDALPAQLAYVDKGIAPVLLAQPTFDWGYKSVNIIVDKLINKKDVPTINKMDLVRVSKENLGEWANQLKTWGFDGVDPKYLAMKK